MAELKVRGAQALAAYSERHGLSPQTRLPADTELIRLLNKSRFSQEPTSSESLLTHFRQRSLPHFFAAFDGQSKTKDDLRYYFGEERQALIGHANRIIEGRFQLLGFEDLYFGQPIDWHLEPNSGKRSPMVHWSRIDEIGSDATGDKKIVWELNRHQYFSTLGRAYWFSGDEKYALEFATHLTQWMDQNPPKLGLNWISSLEIAFRAISWIWALHFFKDSLHLTPQLFARALRYLYLHARHLETYLSTYSSPNTHLTGEALGLFYLGTMLPEFRDAKRWREKGKSILESELRLQVLEDGVYFERATYYHRYTTEFYTHFLILAERNHLTIDNVIKARLPMLLDHLMYVTRPDGTTPFIGDDDGGQLVLLDEPANNDFRATLSTGAALFYRPDYKFVSGEAAESTYWLLGREGMRVYAELDCRPPQMTSRAFSDGGFYVMRDGWSRDANFLLFDCGPHGVLSCGHAHADALSFDLAARGRTLLVDSGTYTYTGSQEMRDHFRSSGAHNVLVIDGESSSVPDGPFSWKETADASLISWRSDVRFDFLQGTHDGYRNLKCGSARHTRSVLFLKNDYWVMRDAVETAGTHQYEQHFHFDVGTQPVFETSERTVISAIETTGDKSALQLFSFATNGDWRIENDWISACYGRRANAPVCTFRASGTGSQEFYSFLIPRRVKEVRARVQEIEAIGGRAFEIRDDGSFDVLLVGDGSLVKTNRLETDFNWAWARFSIDGETLEELVLIDGRSLSFDGLEILNSLKHVEYLVARRRGDKLLLEIDETVLAVTLPVRDLVSVSLEGRHENKI